VLQLVHTVLVWLSVCWFVALLIFSGLQFLWLLYSFVQVRVLYLKTTMGKPVRVY
jgi:hypothetical protein